MQWRFMGNTQRDNNHGQDGVCFSVASEDGRIIINDYYAYHAWFMVSASYGPLKDALSLHAYEDNKECANDPYGSSVIPYPLVYMC